MTVVDGVMPGGPEQLFLREEIVQVLGSTLLDAAAQAEVLERLDQYTHERDLARQEAEFTDDIVRMAVVYERVEGEGASDSNGEGWYEDLEMQSEEVLRGAAGRQELSETAQVARNMAALLHVSLRRQAYSELDLDLLRNAGVNEDELIAQCQEVLTQTARDQGMDAPDVPQTVRERYPTLQSITYYVVPPIWERLVKPMAADLRARLLAAGHVLPVLNEQGLYPDETDETDIE